jgi:hypothetical protein
MSILWKMTVFIEKPPVTSSKCYKTLKNALILMKLGRYVNLIIISVTTNSIIIFCNHGNGGTSQNCEISLFCIVFFPSKLLSKCCNFSMQWDRVKGFSALVKCNLKIDLRPFLVCHMSKIFLAMRGTTAPFKLPKQEGAHPPSGNPLMYHFHGGARRKNGQFLIAFLKRKNSVWGLNRLKIGAGD